MIFQWMFTKIVWKVFNPYLLSIWTWFFTMLQFEILSLMNCSFYGWGQFLQKLCKNCPHPEKPFSNSKTISQIKFPYRIEKLVKSQQEWPGGKTLCRSLVTCKGFFCPVVLLLLLCENAHTPMIQNWIVSPIL